MLRQSILRRVELRTSYDGVRLLSSIADLESSLRSDLTKRRIPILHDYLTPQPSYLLSKSLKDFLPSPSVSHPPTTLPSTLYPRPLPPSHHIAYFPTPTTESELLADGTDILHSPGPPFTRRLWAGGFVRLPPEGGPLLDGRRAVCIEGIRDVRVTGKEGDEKVFVNIERRVARVDDDNEVEQDIRQRVWTETADEQGDAAVIERRDLVFLREKPLDTEQPTARKSLRPPSSEPDFSHTLTPTPALLFRYSALMFNAHSIHLDPLYTRTHEHHPELLVHGPLLLTFMLTCLRHYIAASFASSTDPDDATKLRDPSSIHTIRAITYKNLAPVYCNRPMTVCLKRKTTIKPGMAAGSEWDVWVQQAPYTPSTPPRALERSHEGMCVKGTVYTAPLSEDAGDGVGLEAGLRSLGNLGAFGLDVLGNVDPEAAAILAKKMEI